MDGLCLHLSCRALEHPQQRMHPWTSVFAEQLIAFNGLKVPQVAVENTAGNESSRFVPVEDYHREIMTVWVTAYIRMLILKDQENGKTKQQKKTVPGFPSSPKLHLCSTSHAWHMARIFRWTWGFFLCVDILTAYTREGEKRFVATGTQMGEVKLLSCYYFWDFWDYFWIFETAHQHSG